MKPHALLIVLLLFLFTDAELQSQRLSAGIRTGVNFSDIHGNGYSTLWKTKPGPQQGLFIDYSLTKVLGLTCGLDFSTVYYENYPYNYPIFIDLQDIFMPPYYYRQMMNFSLMNIPVQLRLTILSKPSFNLSAGMYYSIMLDNSNGENDQDISKNDYGYIYSAGLSYPLTKSVDADINLGYTTGRKPFLDYSTYKHGTSELTLGLAYNFRSNSASNKPSTGGDTVNDRISLIYSGGVNVSGNSGNISNSKYSLYAGPSLGFLVSLWMSDEVSFRTGVSFERNGYSMRDSSDVYYRYIVIDDAYYYADTRVSSDYLVIPALLNFNIGSSDMFYFNTGPYLGVRLNARCRGTAIHKIATDGFYQVTETKVNDDLDGLIKDNEFGWEFGAGVSLPLKGRYRLDIGLQFRQGLTGTFDSSSLTVPFKPQANDIVIRNRSLALEFGLIVPVFR